MTPRLSIIGRLAHHRVLANNLVRRLAFLLAVVAFAVLALYPQRYRAIVSLAPTDPASLGLNGSVLQLGGAASVFGSQAALDLSLKIGRGVYVRSLVAKQAKVAEHLGKSDLDAVRWLEDAVVMRTLRGGIIQIDTLNRDPVFAQKLITTYADALRDQLGIIAQKQIAYKRGIIENLVATSSERYQRAQIAYDAFRRQSRYAQPDVGVEALTGRVPIKESQILDKERELNNLLKFATPDNIQVRRVVADLATLRAQLAQAESAQSSDKGSLGKVIQQTTELSRLQRELDVSRELYYNYRRTLQTTSVEDMTAAANIRILEPTYIDPDRQLNMIPLVLAILVGLLGLGIEFYRWRPPVGDRLIGA
jgi:tyrosine-protein kinase Etk/Wzc